MDDELVELAQSASKEGTNSYYLFGLNNPRFMTKRYEKFHDNFKQIAEDVDKGKENGRN